MYFHVLNRAVRRDRLFDAPPDYEAFLRTLLEAQEKVPIGLVAYCIMPNHFHLVVGPSQVPHLSTFMHRLTMMHSKRWHQFRKTTGLGPVYQGRFRCHPIENDTHFLFVCRYVESNPVRADLAERAEQWPWSSLNRDRKFCNVPLSPWPFPQPSSWVDIVNDRGYRVS
jgi:putative transposase